MIIKRSIILSLLIFSAIFSRADNPLGNEWIDYQQQYFAIKITEGGIYRINYNTLTNAGLPLGTFDPRSFQIFHKGEEQPIIVSNENSGIFQSDDYIEFHAKKNDGWFDQFFYEDTADQPNPNYSLINDTATYYLTWNNQLNNKRFIVEEDNNFSGYTPISYFWFTSRQDYTSYYYAGETNNYGVTSPEYTAAEGWFDASFNLGQSRNKVIPTPNIYLSGPSAQIEFTVVGASDYSELNPDQHLSVQFANILIDTIYNGYKLLRFSRSVNPSALNESGTSFDFSSINDLGSTVARNTISYIQIKYPHTFDMRNTDSLYFELPPTAGSKTYTVFSNFNAGSSDNVWLYDFSNNKKIRTYYQGDNFHALAPSPSSTRSCLLIKEANFKEVINIKAVNESSENFARFRDFGDFPYHNSDYLLITHNSLMSSAEDYAAYRESTGYKVLLVDVDELYHQFAYGIGKHPMALRNFARYTISAYDEPPKKLFLAGKARTPSSYRKNTSNYAATLVPSFGNPPSDVLISSGITDYLYAPAIATGRLAAKNNSEVQLYLDKVILYESVSQTPQEWMKNILHFGGGSNINEQTLLANYLKQYKVSLEDTLFGGYVRTFLKSSTDPIQINQSDSLKTIINDGVSLMTFFGHAAGIGFDISIDYPSEYNNYGKYPFLLANSCFAGDIFGSGISSSEEFVLIEGKGVIGYLASTSAAGAFELNKYSDRFTKNLASPYYGKSVGSNIQNTIQEIQSSNSYIKNICLLVTLHGDPAIVINSQPKPDYTISAQDIFTTPASVTSEVDSFYVHVIATNIGRAINDSIIVELERIYPNGSSENIQKRVKTPYYKDTLDFKLPVNKDIGVGINQLKATLDLYNEVEEINYDNNTAITSILIGSTDVIPVYPYKYAIVPSTELTLKASTGNPFIDERNYVFQLDTNSAFLNPIEEIISSKGGVVQWQPPFVMSDSTVYYWRVSIKPEEEKEYSWRQSSFQYISDREGWSQAHFDQYQNNQYKYVSYNTDERIWEFINTVNTIQAQTGVYPYIPWNEVFIKVNGIILTTWSCLADTGNGVIFAVFDPVSGEAWKTYNQGDNTGEYGNQHCWATRPRYTFDFHSTSDEWLELMRDFINIIPEGHFVLVQSHKNHMAESFPEDLYEAFETLGSANIRNIEDNTPYQMFSQKGSIIGSANEVIGGSISSIITLTDSIETNWNQGHIVSERIGPAKKWESIHWQQQSLDGLETDSVWLNILGVNNLGIIDTLYTNIPADSTDIYLTSDINIDAEEYPYLHLMVNMMDDENRTAAQMQSWHVIYEPTPETAINPSLHYVFQSDTIPEGKELVFSTAIQNISDYDMDSLLVNYWIMDQGRNIHMIDYPRSGPHPAGDVLIDTIVFDTKDFSGQNSLWIDVNPNNDQLEQYHFNNVGVVPFFVEEDKSNPLLDVTFDGVRIMDGDIVSAKPNIIMTLKDENPYLLLNDTSLLKVYLQHPGEQDPKRIYFYEDGMEILGFYPATESDNKCKIEYNPEFEIDGTYQLLVQATDRSRNESGMEDLGISFEIVTKSTITEVLNWPNPFSTHTRFVFTLTGSELPTFFKIQILTITGKVVREIDLTELGNIRIGRNITEYAWDGTDQYGDRLANGVYLYRIISNIDKKPIEMNHTDAQKYFHEGFGKMYIIR